MRQIILFILLVHCGSVLAVDALDKRLKEEDWDNYSPFTLLPHKNNYLLPVSYAKGLNPTLDRDGDSAPTERFEAKYQLSLKTPLWTRIYKDQGYLFFAFTQQAYWQAYNSAISSPFRETNYEPELILAFPHFYGVDEAASRIISISLSHQSNGRAGELSRSWNRIKLNWVGSIGDVFVSFSPWYRIPESAKAFEGDPRGDDNPDINDYMGFFELSAAYKNNTETYRVMVRNNLKSNNKGALKLSYSRPLNKYLRWYAEAFTGYGDSLIDYDRPVTRFGIGFELNDVL
ncbi:phospholipase A [Alkalimonas collagenimarina]|uniref:Phospholipase A1 n=1 Tax=Alkalimonas collagenimarina TaxID=400390 RepID=A0ABT9H3N3_9GAMM|nr:phospholipase A [Alkalimonas collagenimarina]MDP4537505.1 phospholipase A [Alkalimonas collagenimarina]